ncbi:hypothetical protein HNQ80_004903 [Anaerosolibacter carboniphilus]|uniref:Helix-turn-helix conjugative transposon-like domain-containing protein n=1 Tax=Anaerosolibacter carboniphilus TaxID=1417629 RepID=A0A841L286_9FIRM|nr:helix-turn-helix domain-containing protein [Anaerosolibacter carboniphilus]MBB6218728.1 hypothetical protein [Anaerosolibacter carboniphilus]
MSDAFLRQLFDAAQRGDGDAIGSILDIFKPMIYKNSCINGCFDGDCFQELCIKFIYCIKNFKFTNISDITRYFN